MTPEQAGTSALSGYLRILRRSAWVVALTAVAVTLAAIGASLAQRHLYEASADVFLSGARNLPSNIADQAQYAVDPERASNTQANLARVPAVAADALKAAGARGRS